jgi:hypothetical protein
MPGKILTCCYCGARSLFAPGAGATLSCETCGAPLKVQKARPAVRERTVKPERTGAAAVPVRVKPEKPHKKPKKKKRRKSLFRKVLSEAVDVIEDIFD